MSLTLNPYYNNAPAMTTNDVIALVTALQRCEEAGLLTEAQYQALLQALEAANSVK
jgi:hypothetical protein